MCSLNMNLYNISTSEYPIKFQTVAFNSIKIYLSIITICEQEQIQLYIQSDVTNQEFREYLIGHIDIRILSLEISPQGKSGGVIFIQSTQGSFVLKPCNSSPSDFFFNELALTLDVNVPVMTIINCYDNQFKKLVFQIEKFALSDQVLSARLKNKLDFPFYQLIQYVPSISLVCVGSQKFRKFINKENVHRLYTMGMVIGFDFIINNNDRFKSIWRGQGNINNILLQIDTNNPKLGRNWFERARDRDDISVPLDNFIFIDHDGNMPSTQQKIAIPNIQKFMEKVTNFQLHIVMFLRKQYSSLPPEFDKLKDQLKFFTHYQLTEQECILVCEGIIYVTKKFIDSFQRKQIEQLYQSIIREVKEQKNKNPINYWNDYWNKQLVSRVHLNFCELYYIKVSAIYTTYPELINEICQRVGKVIQKYKMNKQQRRRVSFLMKGQQQKDGKEQNMDGEDEENSSKKEDANQQNDDEEQQAKNRKRRWRQKLVVFKQDNYKY